VVSSKRPINRSKNRPLNWLVRIGSLLVSVAILAGGCSEKQTSPDGTATTVGSSAMGSVPAVPVGEEATVSGPPIAGDPAIDPAALKLKTKGVLTICADFPYPPFEFYEGEEKFVDATTLDVRGQETVSETTTTKARARAKKSKNKADVNGKPIGITVELMNDIAAGMGLRTEFVNTPFDRIFNALGAGNCDVIGSSITVTKDRKAAFDFSQSYFVIRQAILTRASETSLVSLESLAGQVVGVQAATTGSELANSAAAANGFSVREYATVENLVAGLSRGDVAAVIHDSPIVGYAAIRSRIATKAAAMAAAQVTDNTDATETTLADRNAPVDLGVSKIFDAPKDAVDEYGLVVRKDNPGLTVALNAGLLRARESGLYTQILRKYLGAIAGS
jgi:polar amino acid transport system substrate-binding protein